MFTDNLSNNVIKIVEERDANENILNLNLCNSGIMAVEGKILFEYLDKVQKSTNGEYYLTDIVKICSQNNNSTTYKGIDYFQRHYSLN